MKFLHISDCHGFRRYSEHGHVFSKFPIIEEDFDAVVCSGDFFPNKNWGVNRKNNLIKEEIDYQNEWLIYHLKEIKTFLKNKPFIWSSGNHDWAEPTSLFNKNGIESINIDNKVIEYLGYVWYGFPFIPEIQNNWNFEKNSHDMREEIQKFLDALKISNKFDSLDILVAHSPFAGILDVDSERGGHLGNIHMANALSYQLKKKPKVYFCGHIHASGGKTEIVDDMIVSNAATTWNIVDIST